MSLVAYADSSDEQSDSENDETQGEVKVKPTGLSEIQLNGNISDEDEYDQAIATNNNEVQIPLRKFLNLPAPTTTAASTEEPKEDNVVLALSKLPEPKTEEDDIVEQDDEFLHKKEKPSSEVKPPPPAVKKGPVKITIPSLSEFKDLEIEKSTAKPSTSKSSQSCGLLGLLPKPKHETIFEKANAKPSTSQQAIKSVTSLVPDSVKYKTTKTETSGPSKGTQKRALVTHGNESEESDTDDTADFFSLNSEQNLPQVSVSEINAMVARKAAEIANAASKIDKLVNAKTENPSTVSNTETYDHQTPEVASQQPDLDNHAIKALMGSRAKRQKLDEVNIIELSANEVLPDKGEWLRSTLASSTSYQPKGVLVDEEPAPGTRRKHQITYLAHQAKANELELQAMWSANRHTRRQTQGKYGF